MTTPSTPLDHLPLWALFGAIAGAVLISIETGYRLGKYRRRVSDGEREGPVGAIVGATLGLLAFILAFTFGLAASRFDARRQMVVEEANAIGTTFLRAGLLPDDHGKVIRERLADYVDARLDVVATGDFEKVLRRSAQLHNELWTEAEAMGQKHPSSIVVGLFIESLNETIDVHAKRVLVALQGRLPIFLWGTLGLVTVLTMAGVGYHEGLSKSNRSLAVLVLVLNFSAVITMVADLDRPLEGYLTVNQQAMIDVRKMMTDVP